MTNNVVVIDVETSTHEKGNPNSLYNTLQTVGIFEENSSVYNVFHIERKTTNFYNESLNEISRILTKQNTIVVGFNVKFDLLWLKRYIPDLKVEEIWDCQLHYFFKKKQSIIYPSLDEALIDYGLEPKLNTIQTKYWDKGIDTIDIPDDELDEYLKQDVMQTYKLYTLQKNEFNETKQKLFKLHCKDSLILLEAESNGLYFDEEEAKKRNALLQTKINTNTSKLNAILNPPIPINWDSPAQVSAILYGGTIKERCKVPKTTVLKSGVNKISEVWGIKEHTFSGILKRYSNKNKSVDEDTLKSIRWGPYKQVRSLLLQRRGEYKLSHTYYEGFPKLRERMKWPKNKLYPTYNQCVVVTGRLASSRPNGQNIPDIVKELIKAYD